ncbi:MAG: CocE/NonD family hydrolase [Halieaceae bacterium]|jgi:putative CocE/NonD family hydrolase|nr:CocE/NonD family hydrolase [Halieaceae bacterium]
MLKLFRQLSLATLVALPLAPFAADASDPMFAPRTDVAFPATVQAQFRVPVPMRDGVKLSTHVYLPDGEGRFPTLLVRDIYGNGSQAGRQRYARWATQNGYAFVYQMARGRYDSEGHWYPYFQEIPDGEDTLSWIAQQPWSDGGVGMFGTSYLASVQWLAALSAHPALKAIAPAMSPGNYYRDVAYPGGAFSLLSRASWGIGLVGGRTNANYGTDWINGIEHLPLKTLDASLGFDVRHFRDWLNHPSYDHYWEPLNLEARAAEMDVPALNIGGWYDVFLRSTIGSYTTMRQEARSQRAREGQRLIIGPWPHGWNASTTTGEVDFGGAALINEEALMLEWFDHYLKGLSMPERAPVMLFVMGRNEWRAEQEWPLARTEFTPMYLQPGGALKRTAPTEESGERSYVYDPTDPVPTLGGNIMRPELRGAYDQTPLDERKDILRFVSAPFETRTEITGPIRATLYAASDARDTDFMAKLIVVKDDGRAVNLVDGVIRARYREGFDKPRLLEPGEVYEYDLDLWATSYELSPGDRLRVDISSSNFPRLNRNPNTGAPFGETTEMRSARQTIMANRRYPSRVILPIIPAAEGN